MLVILIAVVGGLVLAAAAAGRRTATAFPRFVASYGYDVYIYNQKPVSGLNRMPGVSSVTAISNPASGEPSCACTTRAITPSNFYINELSPPALRRVVKLIGGKMPAESSPYDVLASFTLEQDYGVHVGSVIHVPLYALSQLSALGNGTHASPTGPTVALHVVGIGAAEMEFPSGSAPEYDLFTTPALHVPSTREFRTPPSTSSIFATGAPAFPGSLRPQDLFTSSMSQIRKLLRRQWRHRSTPRLWAGGSSPSWPRLPALPSWAKRSVGRAWSRVRSTPHWWPWACRGAAW